MSDDPTAIPLSVDPRQQRFRGVAVHGNTPFDVPYMSNVEGNLWVGGCRNGLVLPEEIEHLVSLYPWESYLVAHELKSKLEVRLYDSLNQAFDQIEAIADWVNRCCKEGPTLVHCQAGLNRSNLVAATALIREGMVPAVAIKLLRDQRSPAVLCNTAFENWLLNEAMVGDVRPTG